MTVDSYVLVKSALDQVHKHSFNNKSEVEKSEICHCFYCKAEFRPGDVEDWVVRANKGNPEETALCPKCGIDSVIGDASGYEMTEPLLNAMHEFWFERRVLPEDFDYSWFEPVNGD